MSFASGSRLQLAYIPETVFGTTPSTPQMILLPKQSTTLDYIRDNIDDPTIVSDRMERDERLGNASVSGNLVVTLQHEQFDPLLEAALCGTFTGNELKVGTVDRSFTFELGHLDVAQYRRFTGVKVNTLELAMAPNQVVSATFGLLGAGMTTAQVPLDATPTALVNKPGVTHIGGTITVGGTAVVCTSLNISIANGYGINYGIGGVSAHGITFSESQVTGSATFYFEDLVQYNRFVNETTAEIEVSTTDGTNTLTFTIPKAKFMGGQLPVPNSGVLFLTMPFKGLYDSVTGTTLMVTRSA